MKTYGTIIRLVLLAGLARAAIAQSAGPAFIRDQQGRAVIIHGVNISNYAKYAPDNTSWQTIEDYAQMTGEWGFNTIRYLIFWSAIEPEPGQYDQQYLDRVAERIGWAETLGIHIILDMHQDVYGVKFYQDGAPVWATWDDGLPFEPRIPWWINYLSPAVARAFVHLWTEPELQAAFTGAWCTVAQRFRHSPAVIGFDLFNEPFFGEFWPWNFERLYLAPFYSQLIQTLSVAAPGKICFYEPEIITSTGFRSFLGPLGLPDTGYMPHFYHPLVHEGLPYNGDSSLIQLAFFRRDQEARADNVPWLLGEFGAAANTPGMHDYLVDQLNLLDSHLSGWTYYSYDKTGDDSFGLLDPEGNEQDQLLALVRPYPRAVAGTPRHISYDSETRVARLEFVTDALANGPTEFWTGARRIYPEGFTVSCSDPPGSWHWTYDVRGQTAFIYTNSGNKRHWIELRPAVCPQ